ncbi:tripartite tricarboxylate transporter substrate binding protein [Variovorax sp.]|jgi:tripartite-type tricarboxylate transporter receptor subunit TctC|uniref:tripartite tricarboxylate transporter substrate binding protein n=1 Tax=Variovorax sp. TaxID=1871043 RepID=UPI00121780E8|nr:tripartite tricarboxylate transporter substrate binding protein [Variovorax sp.]TAJ64067.1 MAG: tripartite tricarboxylate transporter substrate binding protein [Variovorax sp.]
MTTRQRMRAAGAALAAWALLGPLPAAAEEHWPAKPVTLLVGFAPGGGTDLIARQVAPRLSELLKQPVIVENRAGASGTIATAAAARARPDGYTLLLGHVSSNAMVPAIMPKLPYAAARDFTAITLIGSVPQVVTVPASLPVKTLQEFIAFAKTKPGGVNYASSGAGTQQHFAAELFQQATRTTMTHVPYKGSGAALADLIAGQVDVNFDTVPTVLQQVKAGKLRALAVTSRQRAASLPEVPTVIEAGVPDYEIGAWYMLMGPAGLPKPVVDALADAMNRTLQSPEVRDKLAALGTDVAGGTPAQAQDYLKAEIARWSKLAADKRIVAE